MHTASTGGHGENDPRLEDWAILLAGRPTTARFDLAGVSNDNDSVG